MVQLDNVASSEDMAGLTWTRRPEPRFPFSNSPSYNNGVVALRCNTDVEGYLKRCAIESEYPDDGGCDPASVDGRTINFLVRFSAYNDYGPIIPSRLPPRDTIRPVPANAE